jgi:hypothetical protein
MEQRPPFTSEYNVLRLNPLTRAVAGRSMSQGEAQAAVNNANVNGPGARGRSGAQVDASPDAPLTPDEVQKVQDAADAGDADAIDWLKKYGPGLAVGGAVATGGGIALRNAMKKRVGVYSGDNFGPENRTGFTMGEGSSQGPYNPRTGRGPPTVTNGVNYIDAEFVEKPYDPGPRRIGSGAPARLPQTSRPGIAQEVRPAITDTTGSRFNMPNNAQTEYLLPDMNAKGRQTDAAWQAHQEQMAREAQMFDRKGSRNVPTTRADRIRKAGETMRKIRRLPR